MNLIILCSMNLKKKSSTLSFKYYYISLKKFRNNIHGFNGQKSINNY